MISCVTTTLIKIHEGCGMVQHLVQFYVEQEFTQKAIQYVFEGILNNTLSSYHIYVNEIAKLLQQHGRLLLFFG